MNVTARPYNTNWSGNGIWYAFYSDEAAADPSINFEVRLRFRRLDANDFSIGPSIPLIPYQGKASINISTLVDAELMYGLPALLNANDITPCPTQTGQFYIEFRVITASNNDPAWDGSEAQLLRNVVKGGVPEFQFNNNGYWNHYFFANLPFLTWQLRGRLAASDERIYLAWYQPYSLIGATLKVVYTIIFTDLSLPPATISLPLSSRPLNVHYLPAGATMVSLQTVNPAKTIWKYTVQVMDYTDPANPGPLSEAFPFEIDNRPNYNSEYVIYRNSCGGLDTARIRGVIEKDPDYVLQQTGQVEKPYYEQGNLITPTQYQQPAQEIVTYKADVGHVKKEEQDRLRDIFLRRELYFVQNKRWWPLNLTSKSFTLTKNTDKTWSLPIEYSLANDGDKFFAPQTVNFGDEYADSNTCNAYIENIIANRQLINGGTICEVTFTFDVAGSISNNVQYSTGFGLGGFVWHDLAYPYVNPLVLRFPANTFATVFLKAICANGYGGLTNSIVVDTSASDAGGGGGGGGTGTGNNSRVTNNSNRDVIVSIRVNGVQIFSKTVKHRTIFSLANFELFYVADANNAVVQVELTSMSATSGTIDSNGLQYHGTLDSNGALVFNSVNIVNGINVNFD